ncbi:DUF3105 domain-containing protein [Nocardia terpenica]|uniref:DUF3105 domain-containing protein n=1 Tax=Nocardia terpenica TaxID=455432 RepID=A0A164PTR9_9NOCA|nr:DUF3105 domain-containing protein [Nocardia terpenica]KZM76057.1 hypothetical protein AWN90_17335 [Nocardia terpenica]NQE85610.1 DUF3105 domain-containing protein [Nocardia terpenica]
MPNTSADGNSARQDRAARSAKAIRAAAKSSKSTAVRNAPGGGKMPGGRRIPWLTVGAAVVIVVLIGALAAYLVPKYEDKADVEKFTPTAAKKDPSSQIPGVITKEYQAGLHVGPTQRVAYDMSPPMGGPHDASWATCTGVVYAKAIRTENAVHSLEHGAIWIAYNPDRIDGAALDTLKQKVQGKPAMLLSPYPGLDTPISVQAWGHQLKLASADDKRINEFISALRLNQYTYPEVGADCANPTFDTANPPPFDPAPPGPDAVPMDGKGLRPDVSEMSGGGIPGLPGGGMPGLPGGIPGLPGVPGAPDAPGAPGGPQGGGQ